MTRVMVFGTFDILHPGHIHFLQAAKKRGDYLIVSLARQSNIRRIKGRAARHSERERKRMLEALKFVDKVVMGAQRNYLRHILRQKPDVIVLGYDQKHYTAGLKKKLAKAGLLVKIVRARPYKPHIYTSAKIKIK